MGQLTEKYQLIDGSGKINGFLDNAFLVLNTFEELGLETMFKGRSALIDNGGIPIEMWCPTTATSKIYWEIKGTPTFNTFESLNDTITSISEALKIGTGRSKKCYLGIQPGMHFHVASNKDGKPATFFVKEVTSSSTDASISIEWTEVENLPVNEIIEKVKEEIDVHAMASEAAEIVNMLNSGKTGNVVYSFSGKVYSYIDEEGKRDWTENKDEIPEGAEFEEFEEGLYVIKKDEQGSTLEKIPTEEDGVKVSGEDAEPF